LAELRLRCSIPTCNVGWPGACRPGSCPSARLREHCLQPLSTRGTPMNSMIRGAVVGLAVMLGAQAAQAQGLSLGLGGGIVVPTGSLSDGLGTGWSGTAQLRVKPPVSPLGFQVDAFYTRFSLDGIDGNSRMLGGTANA